MSVEILNVDCMEYMATASDKFFDLAIVDPPYGIQINVNMGRRKGCASSSYKKFYGGDKAIPTEEYFLELERVSKNQIIWGGNYMTDYLYPSPCWILWDKCFSEAITFAQYEMAWTSFKSSAKKIVCSAASNNDRIHPTQKPVKLYHWLLKNYATRGQKVLDTHLGSGSSAIAAHYFGVDFVGCELDTHYFEASIKRFKQQTAQLALFEG